MANNEHEAWLRAGCPGLSKKFQGVDIDAVHGGQKMAELMENGRHYKAEPTGKVFEQYVQRAAVGSEADVFFLVERPQYVSSEDSKEIARLQKRIKDLETTNAALKNPDRCPNCHLAYTDATPLSDPLDAARYRFLKKQSLSRDQVHCETPGPHVVVTTNVRCGSGYTPCSPEMLDDVIDAAMNVASHISRDRE